MKLKIENTSKLVRLKAQGAIYARVWEGETASGIPVHCYIVRVAVAEGRDAADYREFERELEAIRAPSAEVQAIPLSLVL